MTSKKNSDHHEQQLDHASDVNLDLGKEVLPKQLSEKKAHEKKISEKKVIQEASVNNAEAIAADPHFKYLFNR